MKLLIAGSRNLAPTPEAIDGILATTTWPTPTLLISGGAVGVDRAGERWAEARGIPIHQELPDWKLFGRSAGFVRNETMVEMCDFAVVFWDGESHGTRNTIDLLDASCKDYWLNAGVLLS